MHVMVGTGQWYAYFCLMRTILTYISDLRPDAKGCLSVRKHLRSIRRLNNISWLTSKTSDVKRERLCGFKNVLSGEVVFKNLLVVCDTSDAGDERHWILVLDFSTGEVDVAKRIGECGKWWKFRRWGVRKRRAFHKIFGPLPRDGNSDELVSARSVRRIDFKRKLCRTLLSS